MPDNVPPAAPRKCITIINRDSYRFVLRTPGERKLVQKLLERRGFEVTLAESTRGYAVKLSRQSRYSALLKDSLAMIETDRRRIFLLKDRDAAQQALRQGAKMVEVDVQFPI